MCASSKGVYENMVVRFIQNFVRNYFMLDLVFTLGTGEIARFINITFPQLCWRVVKIQKITIGNKFLQIDYW